MKASELIAAVILKATGKPRELQPADAKYQKIFGIANLYIRQWQREPGVDWLSLYDPAFSIGTIGVSSSYPLDLEEVRKVSDTPGDVVRVRKNGITFNYQTVPADQLALYLGGNYCAQVGESLRFAKEFTVDSPEYGGTIEAPVYLHAPLLTNNQSTVPVDDPMWLVDISAAEYVRNDILLQGQYGNLISEANQLMQKMIEDNDAQVSQLYAPFIPGISDI